MKATKTAVPLERLLEQLPENYTLADRELIHRAYRVAEEAHREQKRHSGEPYINHCLAVASILADLRVPPEVVAAGLLHDTVEDTTITLNDIRRDFSDTIAVLVDGVTKLTNLPRVSRDDQHAENANGNNGTELAELILAEVTLGRKQDLVSETLRKTFLAMGDDVRVVLIKLADRLHNMRTLGFMPEHKRKRIAKETLDIFAPLANRLWHLADQMGTGGSGIPLRQPGKIQRDCRTNPGALGRTAKPRSRRSKPISSVYWTATIFTQKLAGAQSTSIPSTRR